MGHKFDDKWSCFFVRFDDDYEDHELVFIGTMDLKFKPNGELERGTLQYEEEYKVYLHGKSDSGFNPRTLQLESDDYHLFEGTLTFENDDVTSLAVTGKLHFPDDSRLRSLVDEKLNLKTQDDPPWLITKP